MQTYQAGLLKEVDGEGLAPEAVKELHRATDLVLHATKQMGHAIGRSMDPMVNTEWHLWLNLTGIME